MIHEEAQDPSTDLYPFTMSRLLNSIYYFYDFVLIVEEGNNRGYRLIIQHNQKIIYDTSYGSIRGAKIAFTKYCKRRAYNKKVDADWSGFYQPINSWLEKLLASPREIMNKE